jgi:multidrug efflux pump subunit AcrB
VYRYPISIHLIGTSHYQLLGEAEKMRHSFLNWSEIDHAIIDGTDDVSTMHYQINQTARVQYGVKEAALNAWVQLLIAPLQVGVIGNADRLLPVQLEYGNKMPLQSAVKQIGILDQWGNRVPMDALLEMDFKPQMPELTFKNTLATVTLLIKPIRNANIDQLQNKVNQYIEGYSFPNGMKSDLKGQLDTQTQVFSEFLKYAIAIVFIMYGLLVIRFRSFYQPLLIYVTIPLSFAGSFLSIILSGAPLTFIGLLGLTGLTGIVINDGILLIDTANQLIKHGHTVTYATIKAAKSRFFPVVLTSVTTIIGLIPLLVTQNMFQQLALAFVFGLFSSTVFLLLIIPVLYQGGYLIGVVKSQPHTAR